MKFIWACVVCTALLGALNACAEEGLGELFTTPAQRALLDKLPIMSSGERVVQESAPPAVIPDLPVKKAKMNGVIVNSKGVKTTLLERVDSAVVNGSDKDTKTAVTQAGRVEVSIQRDSKKITLKNSEEPTADINKAHDRAQNGTAVTGAGSCRSVKKSGGEVIILCD